MVNSLEVVGHRVLIKPELKADTTDSGIYIGHADTYEREKGATQIGTIAGVGPNAWLDFNPGTPWAYVGDRVCFAKYAFKEVVDPMTEEIYWIINDEDVQCIVHTDEEGNR